MFRRASSGDPCGWSAEADGTFANGETLESGVVEMPAVLALALAVQRADEAGQRAETAERAERTARLAETRRRQLEVQVNEARAGAAAQREQLARWGEAASELWRALTSHAAAVASTCASVANAGRKLSDKAALVASSPTAEVPTATSFKSRVSEARENVRTTKRALEESRKRCRELEVEVSRLERDLGSAESELDRLRAGLREAVQVEVEPMRAEVAAARADLARERLARLVDRQLFAAVWPENHLAPAALRRHTPVSPKRRERLMADALDAAADADLKREIRAKVADAARWSQVVDDYGRQYYAHCDTGEASWEPPEAMLYEPPPGRDALGNVVASDGVDEPRPATEVEEQPVEEEQTRRDDPWVQVTDDWGQQMWKHKITGEVAKSKPGGEAADEVEAAKDEPKPEESSSEDDIDEREPTQGDGASFFVARQRLRRERAERRRRKATSGARRALGFLEEEALRSLERRGGDDDDEPVFVDIQALRELAAGEDGWTYVDRATRKRLEAEARAARIKAEKEAEALEAARRADIQRTLDERRKASGLVGAFEKGSTPEKMTTASAVEKECIASVPEDDPAPDDSRPTASSRLGSDAYFTLLGAADGFDDSDDLAVDVLRRDLEATARPNI